MTKRQPDDTDTELHGEKVTLRHKQLADAAEDYVWRTDHELAEFDATFALAISYPEYLSTYRYEVEDLSPRTRRWAIVNGDGRHIGNCMIYAIDNHRHQTELGILIGDRDYWAKGYGADAIDALLEHVFTTTDIERVYLHTLEWNIRAQKCFAKCGFVPCDRVRRGMHDFIAMEITKRSWQRRALPTNASPESEV